MHSTYIIISYAFGKLMQLCFYKVKCSLKSRWIDCPLKARKQKLLCYLGVQQNYNRKHSLIKLIRSCIEIITPEHIHRTISCPHSAVSTPRHSLRSITHEIPLHLRSAVRWGGYIGRLDPVTIHTAIPRSTFTF